MDLSTLCRFPISDYKHMDQLYVSKPQTALKHRMFWGFFSSAHHYVVGDSWSMDDQIQVYFHLSYFSFVFDFGFSISITSVWSQCQ